MSKSLYAKVVQNMFMGMYFHIICSLVKQISFSLYGHLYVLFSNMYLLCAWQGPWAYTVDSV